MRPSPVRDLIVGLCVLAGLIAIGYLALSLGGLTTKGSGGVVLYATFDEIGGLKHRAPVRVAGVRIGEVVEVVLDESLRARVTLNLDSNLPLPVDTRAEIRTSGVLGNQYLALEPGAEDELLQPGEEIAFTEGALVFERLIGRFVANAGLDQE